ncbi:hypothetical protein EB118_10660 [bacterium]|nr:hypothetical protein [bacterium]NDD82682.1 hypothetical protein [bacterium]NDG30518.1 hypothetical protein [bacterium]
MKENQLLGNLKITGSLNHKSGEYWFTVASENGIKSFSNKCLYDALSDYGINYDKAKDIVTRYSATFDKTITLETFPIDYYKNIPHIKGQKEYKNE